MAENNSSRFRNLTFKIMQASIILAVFFVPLVQFLFYLFFFIALFFWIIGLFYRRNLLKEIMAIPLFKPFLSLVILSSFSFFWGPDPGSTFDGWGKILQAFLSYIMLYEALNSPRIVKKALVGIVIALFITTTYGISGFYGGWEEHARRLTSFFTNPNPLAVYLLLTSFLALGIAFSAQFAKPWRIFALISFVFSVWAMVLTMTRGVWLALPFGIAVFALIVGYKNRRYFTGTLIIILLIAVFLSLGLEYELFPSYFSRRVENLFTIDSGRERIWRGSWEMFKDNPILGVGAGNFSEAAPQYMEGRTYSHAHNLFIHIALELGLLGIFAVLWFVYELGRRLIPLLFLNSRYQFILAGIFGVFSSFFIHTLTDLSIYDRGLALVLVFVISLGIYLSQQEYGAKKPVGEIS